MAAPVWMLSVDLQAKTATFTTGLADAAKSARGSFSEIKGGSKEAGEGVEFSMMEARHSVMMLGEEFGIHLPRALAGFIAGLGPIGPALEAAFPFLAIAGLATMLIEHLVKMHEEGEKLTSDQINFGTAAQNAFNTLDEKLTQAKIRADELRNDHLGALKLQLELIDKQSMSELVHAFEEVAKAADTVMKDLEGHWYTVGIGSAGAKHALTEFKDEYESLLAQGKDDEAGGLLKGTLSQAQKVLQAQKDTRAYQDYSGAPTDAEWAAEVKFLKDKAILKAQGVSDTDKELAAQEQIVQALQAQVTITQKVEDLKKAGGGNAKTGASNEAASQQASASRAATESMLRMGEQNIAAERATADAELTIHRASLEARLASGIDFAGRERDTQLAANAAELSGLDRAAKDYLNQVKANKEKALEISNEYSVKVAEMSAKASVAEYARDLQATEQAQREKIEFESKGSTERLAAINDAIKAEQSANLQDTNFYRELLNMRVETIRQSTEEENKLRADAAKEAANSDEKLGALSITALRQHFALLYSERAVSSQQRIDDETEIANQEFDNKMKAFEREKEGLDKSGKDYNNKVQQLQDQEKQLRQQHENELSAIREKAEIETNDKLAASYQKFTSTIAGELSRTIMGHQSMAKMIQSLGDQMISSMLENAVKYALSNKFRQESDARAAASAGFKLGMEVGGPAGPVLGPVFAAAAFAGAMAFESGGIVPGVTRGDSVPSMLTPGEGVVPGGVMDGLSKMARAGGFTGGGTTQHVHFHPTYNIHTIDGDGMEAALEKNRKQVTRHIEHSLRRMNK